MLTLVVLGNLCMNLKILCIKSILICPREQFLRVYYQHSDWRKSSMLTFAKWYSFQCMMREQSFKSELRSGCVYERTDPRWWCFFSGLLSTRDSVVCACVAGEAAWLCTLQCVQVELTATLRGSASWYSAIEHYWRPDGSITFSCTRCTCLLHPSDAAAAAHSEIVYCDAWKCVGEVSCVDSWAWTRD